MSLSKLLLRVPDWTDEVRRLKTAAYDQAERDLHHDKWLRGSAMGSHLPSSHTSRFLSAVGLGAELLNAGRTPQKFLHPISSSMYIEYNRDRLPGVDPCEAQWLENFRCEINRGLAKETLPMSDR
jgi:hypothetical protein